MQIAALTSALGLAGAAIAYDTDGTTSNDDRSSVSGYGMEAPASGAIVTPADKAAGMGQDTRAGSVNGDVDDDTAKSSTPNDDTLSVSPGPSNDEELSVNPPSNDEEASINPRGANRDENAARAPASSDSMNHGSASMRGGDESAPARTGSDVHPGDMGPGNVRGD
jgi:hypothetical protein